MGLIRFVKEEIAVIRERDPAIHSNMEVFLYPSFKAMLYYRVAHRLYGNGHYFWARWVSQRGAHKTGIEIHPGARIGRGLFIDHGQGVIIGETTVIGDNVTLYQGVTLGGTGKEHGKRHPTLENNVVLEEVPPNSTVVGVPGRVVKRGDVYMPREDLNQVDLPDPVREDIQNLRHANAELINRLLDLEKEVQILKKEKQKQQQKQQ